MTHGRQLEEYVACELGREYLAKVKSKSELQLIKKEISSIMKRLEELQIRKIVCV